MQKRSLPPLINSVVIRKGYTIERRIYKDSRWLGGWSRQFTPIWGEWEALYSYSRIKFAGLMYKTISKDAAYNKLRTEYRMVKDIHALLDSNGKEE